MKKGSVGATMLVYSKFKQYKSGVYRSEGKFLGGHAVRLIGWGE